MARRPQIWHWRQDDEIKNFGDYLADFLTHEMFEPISWHEGPVHVIGSVIADFLVPESDVTPEGMPQPKVVFWGCGARDENGLSEDRMDRATILAVRGPKTASVLKLGAAKPQGDIAFFLPALYKPKRSRLTAGKSVCIPHFWDRRPDADFDDAGCGVVLRTNITAGGVEIRRLIDAIASADFVLTASLHGAVVAAAYGVPFAFWGNGHIDLPFKWEDLAAYLSIPNVFYDGLSEAKAGYEADIKGVLKLPPLWAFLACAPFPIRPAAMAKIVQELWTRSDVEDATIEVQEMLEEFGRREPDNDAAANAFMNHRAELAQRVAQAHAEIQRLEDEKAHLIQSRNDIGGVAQSQELALHAKDDEISCLKASVGNAEAHSASYRSSTSAAIISLQEEIRQLQREVAEKTTDLIATRDQASAAINDQITSLSSENAALSAQVKDQTEAILALNAQVTESRAETESFNNAIKANLERLTAQAAGLANGLQMPDPEDFDTPADLQALFQHIAGSISDMQNKRQADAGVLQRLDGRLKALTDDANEAWRQAAEARESLRVQTGRVSEDKLVNASLTARLEDSRAELELAVRDREALHGAVAEQDRLLQNALANVAALSRQVDLAGRDTDRLRRQVQDAEVLRQTAQNRYEKISNSGTWRWVRRTRKVRDYFAAERLRQRGRRIVRILTGKRKKKPTPVVTDPLAATVLSGRPASSLSLFIVDIGGRESSASARENVARLAQSGAQVILCGDVERWAGSSYLTVPSAAANIVDHLDHHLSTTNNATTVVVFGADTIVSGDIETFAEVFRSNPSAVVACGVETNVDGRLAAAGARLDETGSLEVVGAGLPQTDFRVASICDSEMVWPLVVGIDADGFRHLGGLRQEASGEAALIALGVDTRRRGLNVVVNPFVQAIRGEQTVAASASPEVVAAARELVPARKPRVLFTDAVTPTPDRDSGSIDIYWYMRIFLALGYEVTFLPVQDLVHAGRYTTALRMLGIRCPLNHDFPEPWMFLRDYGAEFDLILTYRASAACYVIDPIVQFAPQATVIFDTVDLHFLREERAAELSGSADELEQAQRTRVEELKIMGLSDATILLSSLEYDHIGEIAPEVRRYLISIVRPVPGCSAPASGRRGSMFVGGFKHSPNTDAALFLCSEVWPRVRLRDPAAELNIIGSDAPPQVQALHDPSQGINIVGFVEDLNPFYASMRVNLAPLRYGAGVKGKVAASLSVGLPTVATPTAVEGMFLEDGRDVLVREDPDAFADAVIRLSNDDALWDRLSHNAIKAAKETFSIEAAQSRIVKMLTDLGLPHG